MTRLKRLRADNNALYSAGLAQLSSLVLLSLAHNRVEMLCGMEYLHNLVNLNLSDNLISGTVRLTCFIIRVSCRVVRVSCVCACCAVLTGLAGCHTGGFSELGKLKALQVLNLSYNNIALTFNKFHHKYVSTVQSTPMHCCTNYGLGRILRHLQSLPKLRYLYFNGNPVQQSIFKYRFFVISQLPKLHFLDGDPVTKEVYTHTHRTRTKTTRP
jgi:Leucine-rich repeat (LRR) protein